MSHNKRRSRRNPESDTPTIKEVAAYADVSTATVSRVLAGLNTVSDELTERVREAVRALNYQPNRIARNLRIRATRTIGVIIPDLQNPFFTSIVRGIEDHLQAYDYMLFLCNSDENIAREQIYLTTLRAEGVAGIILAPTTNQRSEYQHLKDNRMPLVAVDRIIEGLEIDTVTVTNAGGARAATAHLIGLGHRRIGMISGPAHLHNACDRLAGYRQAFAAAGLPVIENLIQYGDFRQATGYEAMRALLDLPEPPTAVFITNNLMTLGALQLISERGLQVPSDIALISFDDMPWAVAFPTPLTAVAQPTYDLGLKAARRLIDRIKDPQLAIEHVVLETQLVVRASCGSGQRHYEVGGSG